MKSSSIIGRSYVVHQWLTILEVINRHYQDVPDGTPELPPFPVFKQAMERSINNIMEGADVSSSERDLRFERNSGSDAAEARATDERRARANAARAPIPTETVDAPDSLAQNGGNRRKCHRRGSGNRGRKLHHADSLRAW